MVFHNGVVCNSFAACVALDGMTSSLHNAVALFHRSPPHQHQLSCCRLFGREGVSFTSRCHRSMRKLPQHRYVKRLVDRHVLYTPTCDRSRVARALLVSCWQFVLQSWSDWRVVSRYVGRSRNTRRRGLIGQCTRYACTQPALREVSRRFVRCAPLALWVVCSLVSPVIDNSTSQPLRAHDCQHLPTE